MRSTAAMLATTVLAAASDPNPRTGQMLAAGFWCPPPGAWRTASGKSRWKRARRSGGNR